MASRKPRRLVIAAHVVLALNLDGGMAVWQASGRDLVQKPRT